MSTESCFPQSDGLDWTGHELENCPWVTLESFDPSSNECSSPSDPRSATCQFKTHIEWSLALESSPVDSNSSPPPPTFYSLTPRKSWSPSEEWETVVAHLEATATVPNEAEQRQGYKDSLVESVVVYKKSGWIRGQWLCTGHKHVLNPTTLRWGPMVIIKRKLWSLYSTYVRTVMRSAPKRSDVSKCRSHFCIREVAQVCCWCWLRKIPMPGWSLHSLKI